jgi:hypothetical protein
MKRTILFANETGFHITVSENYKKTMKKCKSGKTAVLTQNSIHKNLKKRKSKVKINLAL